MEASREIEERLGFAGARRALGGVWGPYRGPHVSGIESRACDSAYQATLEYLLDNIWIVGGPETVAKKVAALGDAVGGLGRRW